MSIPSDPAQALLMRQVTFNPAQGGGSQVNTGPSVPTNSNPLPPLISAANQPYVVSTPPSPQINGVAQNPAIPLPANANEQNAYGNSVINRGFPQWSAGGESGMVTGR